MKNGLRFKSPYFLQNFIWIPTRFLFKIFLKIQIEGVKALNVLPPGVIFAVNHSSELDAVILPASLPFFSKHSPMFYVSREKSFYVKSGWRQLLYGGWCFMAWGAYSAKVGLHDYGASLSTHTDILEHGGSVCIFPEGRRNLDGIKKSAKGGVAYLAWKTNKPVVPVCIEGARNTSMIDFILCRKQIKITFGQAIRREELFKFCAGAPIVKDGKDDFVEAAQIIMSQVWALNSSDKKFHIWYPSHQKESAYEAKSHFETNRHKTASGKI